jgi:hypothetical protein
MCIYITLDHSFTYKIDYAEEILKEMNFAKLFV